MTTKTLNFILFEKKYTNEVKFKILRHDSFNIYIYICNSMRINCFKFVK